MAYALSVNLEYAFREAGEGIPDRVRAAAAAGFDKVEMFLTQGRDLPAIRDVPGRGEPGSGTIDWPAFLALLRRLGYDGVIGLELTPTRTPSGAALAYIQRLCATA